MAKINKQYYYNKEREKKINLYKVCISKEVLSQSGIKEDDEIKVYAKDGKIIVEKV